MKVTEELIKEVVGEIIGEDVFPLVVFLKDNENVSEFIISKKINIPVDIVRNQLYRLYNENLVDFIRKKDKIKGWYIYYWTLNKNRIKYLVTELKRRRIIKIKDRIERERNNHYFSCSNLCIRVDFEQATNFEYKCPECGELIHQEDNTEKINSLYNQVEKLEKDVKKEEEIIQKAAEKEAKKEEEREEKEKEDKKAATKKKAAEKRAAIREIKKAEKKAAEKEDKKVATKKKTDKKTTKKKTTKKATVKKTATKKITKKKTTKKK